jgi:hypothetical protein
MPTFDQVEAPQKTRNFCSGQESKPPLPHPSTLPLPLPLTTQYLGDGDLQEVVCAGVASRGRAASKDTCRDASRNHSGWDFRMGATRAFQAVGTLTAQNSCVHGQ